MKYYFDGEKMHSTSLRMTGKWIHAKNVSYRNNIGSVYSSKKSAIKAWLKNFNQLIDLKEIEIGKQIEEIDKLKKKYRKTEKLIVR